MSPLISLCLQNKFQRGGVVLIMIAMISTKQYEFNKYYIRTFMCLICIVKISMLKLANWPHHKIQFKAIKESIIIYPLSPFSSSSSSSVSKSNAASSIGSIVNTPSLMGEPDKLATESRRKGMKTGDKTESNLKNKIWTYDFSSSCWGSNLFFSTSNLQLSLQSRTKQKQN